MPRPREEPEPLRSSRARKPCDGTNADYQRHLYWREEPCNESKQAHQEANNNHKKRLRERRRKRKYYRDNPNSRNARENRRARKKPSKGYNNCPTCGKFIDRDLQFGKRKIDVEVQAERNQQIQEVPSELDAGVPQGSDPVEEGSGGGQATDRDGGSQGA